MNRGIQAAASGMRAFQTQLDVIANNLANINTNGYKSDGVAFADRLNRSLVIGPGPFARNVGELGGGAEVAARFTEQTAGPSVNTGGALDAMLEEASHFFAVRTPQGIRYTRDGAFTLNANNELVTKSGHPVLDQTGDPIQIPIGATPSLTPDGRVVADEVEVGLIGVFQGQFEKAGENLWIGNGQQADNPRLLVGSLEGSNVNAVQSMVEMILLMRQFEGAQRAVRTQDELYEKLIGSLANR
ncbi:MAG: flagellar hook-basal body protein [Fimbriimonadales bacterium]|nr:flagellar hook-basal body protein [Fimbriimonadales bacterium]